MALTTEKMENSLSHGGRRFTDLGLWVVRWVSNVIRSLFEFRLDAFRFKPRFSNVIAKKQYLHLSFTTSTMTAEKHMQIEVRTGINFNISSVINKIRNIGLV